MLSADFRTGFEAIHSRVCPVETVVFSRIFWVSVVIVSVKLPTVPIIPAINFSDILVSDITFMNN